MKLPCSECKGRCCTYPVFTAKELRSVKLLTQISQSAIIHPVQVDSSYDPTRIGGEAFVVHLPNGNCPFLGEKGCTIFGFRPQVCRDYGEVPELPCEYLYPKEALRIQEQRLREAKIQAQFR